MPNNKLNKISTASAFASISRKIWRPSKVLIEEDNCKTEIKLTNWVISDEFKRGVFVVE